MNQYQVHNLFPTPLFVHDDITSTEEQREFIYSQKWYRPPADNGWLTNNHYILDEDVMKTLKDKIMNCMEMYAYDVMKLPMEMGFRMTNSWAVKHTEGDWAQQHIHTNSIFSGVYYLDTNEETGNISFHRDTKHHVLPMTSRPGRYTERNEYNTDEHKIDSNTNRLVLFPSEVLHSVGKSVSKWDRYSLAFNFYSTGHWGEKEHELIL